MERGYCTFLGGYAETPILPSDSYSFLSLMRTQDEVCAGVPLRHAAPLGDGG